VSERAHLSIGEVLSLLREEFADVSISKIRFLESQGLLDPERTPSGYRRFYEEDVERLRWILRQQREHFLPLKVIKGRLTEQVVRPGEQPTGEGEHEDAGEVADANDERSEEPTKPGTPVTAAVATGLAGGADATVEAGVSAGGPAPSAGPAPPTGAAAGPRPSQPGAGQTVTAASPATVPAGHRDAPGQPDSLLRDGSSSDRPLDRAPSAWPEPARSRAPRRATLGHSSDEMNLTIDELAAACGLPLGGVKELERFGLLSSRDVGGTAYYDEEALAIANLAAAFASHGVEARHLRMYKNGAERESGLFEQVVMPLIKQRNPEARRQASATLEELARLGGELRETLLRHSLRDAF
jgi:DNA-binding transcriptional MerR regulator